MTNSSAITMQILIIVFSVMLALVLIERYMERAKRRLYIRYEFCKIKCAHPVDDIAHAQRIANCLDRHSMTDVRVVNGAGRVTHYWSHSGHIIPVEA